MRGTQQMYQAGTDRLLAFNNGWMWDYDATTGNLSWEAGASGNFIEFVVSSGVMRGVDWLGPWQGNGAYIATSDERTKTHIEPAKVGLAEILGIKPIRFRRKDREREEIGFSAQQLAPVLPQAVLAVGTAAKDGPGSLASDDPILGITTDTIVAALVNAVKALERADRRAVDAVAGGPSDMTAPAVNSLLPQQFFWDNSAPSGKIWAGVPTAVAPAGLQLVLDIGSGTGGGGAYLPMAGGSMTGPLYYTATGGTVARSAQDRAVDVANAIDFGADPSGGLG